eukprot:CAMPEP_0116930394 /NCGR_PEP_ID=MMETSP0467-20121206/27172_1 /TAXON_ID=283647 /ORGANISM="Mesodinium pulex, Strain SPMC105" /LENGTH=144 /DNA_ID=CAMNT_0004610589 /DNA_START=220 /DNA_END=651 /DNA_ORIENTATION=-
MWLVHSGQVHGREVVPVDYCLCAPLHLAPAIGQSDHATARVSSGGRKLRLREQRGGPGRGILSVALPAEFTLGLDEWAERRQANAAEQVECSPKQGDAIQLELGHIQPQPQFAFTQVRSQFGAVQLPQHSQLRLVPFEPEVHQW